MHIFTDNFKVLINTNYNKYSNILEVNINRLHNKLIDESNLIINSTTNEIDKTFSSRTNLVMLITIFTGVFFIFMNFYHSKINLLPGFIKSIVLIFPRGWKRRSWQANRKKYFGNIMKNFPAGAATRKQYWLPGVKKKKWFWMPRDTSIMILILTSVL